LSTGIQSRFLDGVAGQPLQATTLRLEALSAIRHEILSGRLAPGARLVEADLAARLGVSRNPIREAITRLEQQGLVVSIANRGAFVVQPTPEQARDMFLLRAHLEHLALRLAFARSGRDIFAGVVEVGGAMTRLARAAKKLDEDVWGDFSLLDARFHTQLVQASGSPALLRAWEAVAPTDLIFLYDQTRPVAFTRAELQGMAARHGRLVRALQSGDPRVAQAELRTHFMAVSRGGTVSLDEGSLAILDWDPNGALEAAGA
jgi:DNA-binding GntR family transcriptional regulator